MNREDIFSALFSESVNGVLYLLVNEVFLFISIMAEIVSVVSVKAGEPFTQPLSHFCLRDV